MACGASYMAMVRTASGLTPSKLWSSTLIDLASSGEFSEWEAVAVRLRDEAFRRLYELGDVEKALSSKLPGGAPIYPRYEAMRAIYDPLNTQVNDLIGMYSISSIFSSDVFPTSFNAGVQQAAQTATDLACLIEQIDAETAKLGGVPRPLSETASGSEKSLGILGTAALVLGSAATVGVILYTAKKVMA